MSLIAFDPQDAVEDRCVDCFREQSECCNYDEELCSGGRCPKCCEAEQGDCHLTCTKCRKRVLPEDACTCCRRCYEHECAKEERAGRDAMALEEKGYAMRERYATGGEA